jgi:uncharacterized membrane-anchored protein
MSAKDVRNWLGIYFLVITGALGAYLLLFRETALLPISRTEAVDAFEIVIPVLLAEVTMIFRWFSGQQVNQETEIAIPRWVVVGPPIMVSSILVLAILTLILGNVGQGKAWAPTPDAFKGIVTFCVSILNASTVFIVSKYFGDSKSDGRENV